ncbi:MAG: DUF192 domain-containing protein [Candidatus Aenigmatarchaeota archaeon]|nr:MAG: DUF192 domain-containing protein [Candidatus Aenigmarchaeota archaeon]
MKNTTVTVHGRTLRVRAVFNILSQMRGMMFRSWRDVGDGMLFVFPREARWGVEMPFCVPMDLVFVDRNGIVVDVQEATPWKLNPLTWKIYKPCAACAYVLELRPGLGKLFKRGSKARLNL